MQKNISWKLINIHLNEWKVLWESFIRFIEKGIDSWYKWGFYSPMWDNIGKWNLKEEINYYQKWQEIANMMEY